MKYPDIEFICPISTFFTASDLIKEHGTVEQAVEKVRESNKVVDRPPQRHLISDPVITSCCGHSLCLKCAVERILNDQRKHSYEYPRCCFCHSLI
jgi:hypothetical protein